ncbi:MAG: DUF3301 domain-containing protein [Burkholderiales bacterium]|nr:DUF3301 domain-containing protein [Burkholderiales bacterium]
MPVFEILAIVALAALGWLWFDSLKAREAALEAARAACGAEGLQLLDATVAIAGLALARDHDGRVLVRRAYEFEFSDTGDNRRKGGLVLLGNRVVLVNVGPRPAPPLRIVH